MVGRRILLGAVAGLVLLGAAANLLAAQEEELRKARDLVRTGRAEEAIPIYASLVAATPNDPALRMNLAIAYFTAKRYESAIGECETVLAVQPSTAAAWLFLGASHFQLERPAQAATALEKAVAMTPQDPNARLMLAEALLRLDREEEAIGQFEILEQPLAGNPRVWYGLERGYSALAESALKKLAADPAATGYVHALRADQLREQGFYGQALFQYRQARASLPDLPGIDASIRGIYLQTGHREWASALESKIRPIECDDGSAQCLFLSGRYKSVLEQTAAKASGEPLYWRTRAARVLAEAALDRLAVLPPSAQWHEIRARRLEERGSHSEAIEEWREALELSPGNPVLERGLAISLHGNRAYEQALPLIEKLRAVEPDSPDLRFLAGTALLGLGRAADAIPELLKAVELRPDFSTARGELGRAFLQTGQAAEAIPYLESSLNGDADGSRRFQLARAYRAVGRTEEAAKTLEEYQELRRQSETRARDLQAQFTIGAP